MYSMNSPFKRSFWGQLLILLCCGPAVHGQSDDTQSDTRPARAPLNESPSNESTEDSDAPSDFDQAALEKEFERTMTGARLEGYWQMTGEQGLADKGALTEPRKESYVISKVSKIGGDRWLVLARITFADKDVNVPVPVRVVWAGDTAVITLDDVGVPLIGTYSARVMIHQGFYSGIWYSNVKNYGGVMAGKIMPEGEQEQEGTKPESLPADD